MHASSAVRSTAGVIRASEPTPHDPVAPPIPPELPMSPDPPDIPPTPFDQPPEGPSPG